MKMHLVLCAWLWLACGGLLRAGGGTEEAWRTASAFWTEKHGALKRTSPALRLWQSVPGGYVFVPAEGAGFVWVDESVEGPAVRGYSLTADVCREAVPECLAGLMNAGGARVARRTRTEPVAPLLSSVWTQLEPYNGMCPYYRNEDGTWSTSRCRVGCVATAASEVMRFHAWPEALLDTLHGWRTPHYELSDVLPGTRLDWAHMLDRYDGGYTEEEVRAVQELGLYCGMACRMNYGVNASGSSTYNLLEPLEEVFGYRYVHLYDRSFYSPSAWRAMLSYELHRGVPLVYVGYNVQFSAHAFVLDGMDDEGYFHIRWGEGGVFDGYFDVDILNAYEPPARPTETGREMGLFCNQSVLAFHPEELDLYPGDTLAYAPEDITVERVAFRRDPDTQGMVTADVSLTNHSADTITYTVLAFTTSAADSIVWDSVETVGITSLTLYPGRTASVPVRCQFRRAGDLYFGLTGDMDYAPYCEPLTVASGTGFNLRAGAVKVVGLEPTRVSFEIPVTNVAAEGRVEDLFTYHLVPDDDDKYVSAWSILDVPAGATVCDTVTYAGLRPRTGYTLRVRYPWSVVATCEIRTPDVSGVDATGVGRTEDDSFVIYTLQGTSAGCASAERLAERLDALPGGVYLVVGRQTGAVKKVSVY